jgi:APA family basic amino acid/polyamine antiporter
MKKKTQYSVFACKPITRILEERGEKAGGLRRVLGPVDLMAIGIGAIVGAGIFIVSGIGAQKASPAVVLSFILAAIASAFAALCYSELAALVPVAGSAYT